MPGYSNASPLSAAAILAEPFVSAAAAAPFPAAAVDCGATHGVVAGFAARRVVVAGRGKGVAGRAEVAAGAALAFSIRLPAGVQLAVICVGDTERPDSGGGVGILSESLFQHAVRRAVVR